MSLLGQTPFKRVAIEEIGAYSLAVAMFISDIKDIVNLFNRFFSSLYALGHDSSLIKCLAEIATKVKESRVQALVAFC
jgi:hypothetical protein